MNALLMLAVLSTGQTMANGASWHEDYGVAMRQTKQVGMPLLIVIDRPRDAAARVEQISHRESTDHSELLASYVLCHVDATSEYGQSVAEAFGVKRFPYTAVIDKTFSAVLFTKTGQFTSDEWTATLARYQRGVRPISYQMPVYQQYYQPTFSRAFCSS